jgi:cell division protease FtsH
MHAVGDSMTDAEEHATDEEARAFARAFLRFLSWVHDDPGDAQRNPVVALVRAHLGDAVDRSILGNELPVFEHVNLQVAVNVWIAAEGRTVAVHGISIPPHYEQPTMQQLVHGEGLGPVRLSAPDLVDLPSGPDQTIACLRRAVLLVEDVRGRYVVMIRGPERHQEPVLAVEVAGLPTAIAQEVLRELAELRHRLNVYRGQLLELAQGQNGLAITFPVLATTSREDVVLPEQTLRRVERHTLDIETHRDALRLAGQHLKRGLLLFGPPGTGKTHTMRYVVQQLRGATVILLSGQSLHAVSMITQMARDLQPAVVVLEDVDLVAEDRSFGPGPNPVLFSLLDAMDGAAADADLLFLLTTNRADLLEPALAARPGRVDVAIEIVLPSADSRRRLLEVYTRGVPLELDANDLAGIVARTEGVTASFIKELVRRSVLEALTAGRAPGEALTADDVGHALDDLLDSTQAMTRALLGGGADQRGGWRGAEGHGGVGWLGPGVQYGVWTQHGPGQ